MSQIELHTMCLVRVFNEAVDMQLLEMMERDPRVKADIELV